jgi:hypothetical protein
LETGVRDWSQTNGEWLPQFCSATGTGPSLPITPPMSPSYDVLMAASALAALVICGGRVAFSRRTHSLSSVEKNAIGKLTQCRLQPSSGCPAELRCCRSASNVLTGRKSSCLHSELMLQLVPLKNQWEERERRRERDNKHSPPHCTHGLRLTCTRQYIWHGL